MKKEFDRVLDLGKVQQDMIQFWKDNKTFEKSVDMNKDREIVFYDGPPFATGKPHMGHILVSFMKDMIARYQTMQGNKVSRDWGWDCHGLPTEVQVENLMGITNKQQIENEIGVATFIEKCREIVSQNNDAWKEYVETMARWVDYDNSYKTMNNNFMESVIWAFKDLYDKGLIYKDYRVTPYCHRCQTALSISDTRSDDSTRPRQDRWTMAKFKTNETLNNKPVYFLAWTTTPWTLPSNMALAVNDNIDYAYVEVDEEVFVLAKNAVGNYKNNLGEEPHIVKVVKGSELVGKDYVPLFDFFEDKRKEGAFKVISADYVAEGEGVSIVHIAPAFGEDDYWACKKSNVPLVCPVNEKGQFTEQVPMFEGKNVFETNSEVVRYLKENNLYFADGTLVHNYPHCWRCKEPLIYKAMEAWYVSIDKLKERLIEKNESVNWIPDFIKTGRFGNWLANARDWNISRNRYWGTPLPVWECAHCGKKKVAGSIAEIEKLSGQKVADLHKQYLDAITFKCECGHEMKRVSEVLDCWFESGSVPFARLHYPFENKEWFDKHSPSDFVVEYTGQVRCWFYYLHVLSVGLFDKPAYKNCIVHGTLLDNTGKKLSKSSKNYTDPMELMKTYGSDAMRLYLLQSNAVLVNDMTFDNSGLKDSLQQIVLPMWNCASFYQSYANIDNFEGNINCKPNSNNSLDKWILAKLYATEKVIKCNMDNYRVDEYVKPVASLIDGLSNWYIRRSRRRFWGNGLDEDKKNAYETLYYVLVNTCKILAPIAPIIAEKIFKTLTNEESVHLCLWPQIGEEYKNEQLLKDIDLVQEIIHLARPIRTKNNIKNRQPLQEMFVAFNNDDNLSIVKNYKDLICEELNVKNVNFVEKVDEIAEINYLPNFNRIGKTMGKSIPVISKSLKEKTFKVVDGSFVITGSDGDIVLTKDDVLVNYKAKTNMPVMSDGEVIVSLNLEINAELEQEGVAREIVRNVQDARKLLNCNITDRIYVEIKGDLADKWKEYVCKETLADSKVLTNNDYEFKLEDKDIEVAIEIKRN